MRKSKNNCQHGNFRCGGGYRVVYNRVTQRMALSSALSVDTDLRRYVSTIVVY